VSALPLGEYLEVTRARLLGRFPFFGILVMNLPLVPDERVRTAATDGARVYYNPAWFEQLRRQDDGYVMGVLACEVMHPALGHLWRRGERDIRTWNLSCDLVINALLQDSSLALPPDGMHLGKTVSGVCLDPTWTSLSEEEIYQRLPDPPPMYLLCGDILAPADGNGQKQGGTGSTYPRWPARRSATWW
jgi:predicted metal-dependent peptidase